MKSNLEVVLSFFKFLILVVFALEHINPMLWTLLKILAGKDVAF